MQDQEETEIKCFACHGKGQPLQPWSYEPRPLGPEDVEVAIQFCGICASDIHTLDSGWGPTIYPVVVGHEIVGKVTAVGEKVQKFSVGDRVGIGAQVGACLSCDLCKNGMENHCDQRVFTYDSKYPDGTIAYGGYAERIRASSEFVFHIPDALASNVAAPLFCAGVTVFAPLRRRITEPNMRVGIVGIGGLGHLAIQLARAMDAYVVAISHSANKKADALDFGAHEFLDRSKAAESDGFRRKLDLMLITSHGPEEDWETLMDLVKVRGRIVDVGLPDHSIQIAPRAFTKEVSLEGSLIGSRKDVRDMLAFAAKHNIRAQIEEFEMGKCNDAIKHFRAGNARYRIVLKNPEP